MIVSSHAKKPHFHKKGFARSLGPKKKGFGTPEILCSFYYVNMAELVVVTRKDHLSFEKKNYG